MLLCRSTAPDGPCVAKVMVGATGLAEATCTGFPLIEQLAWADVNVTVDVTAQESVTLPV